MASNKFAKGLKRSALTVALGLCFAGAVQAQSTSGSIYGDVGGQGATVSVTSDSGFSRTITTDAAGRYTITSLPAGNYTVTVSRDGAVVGTRVVRVIAGSGADVSFGGDSSLGTVVVTGQTVRPIDISAVDTRSVLTAQELERIPVGRSAEAIALLAPGAISGAGGYFGGLVSFGGSGVSENAYYVNGYFTGEPLSNLGGFTLPYGSIEQQESFIGGYSAMYGRSDGGVISQIGKRGTNEWHFGGQVTWVPKSLREHNPDTYFPNLELPKYTDVSGGPDTGTIKSYEYTDDSLPGTIYTRGSEDDYWRHSYSAYVGGPLIKDRLFMFLSAEAYQSNSESAPSALGSPRKTHSEVTDPKFYAKIDWNITDNHFLEFTYMGEKYKAKGNYYDYNFDTATEGDKLDIVPTPTVQNSEYFIAKYTGYLTDSLTLSATYGQSRFSNRGINPGILPGVPYVVLTSNQDPAITGGTPIPNRQSAFQGQDGQDYTKGLRADLEWVIGDHALTVGIDNIKFEASNEGTAQVAPYWRYEHAADPTANISPTLNVGAPGGDGYYARQLAYFNSTDMSLTQKAWYVQDRWQVTDNVLLSLGLRNDQFTNKNNFGEAYMDAKNQWAPRLGVSWDVFGDSSMKVFANAGRYFLALPNNVAIRGASASTFTYDYYTYTGIDSNGAPTGLTPVPGVDGTPPPGPVSSNGETGGAVDVLSFAPSDLKNMYQDEYILGMEKTLGENWTIGAKFTHRSLLSSVDDVCDPYTLMDSQGLIPYGTDATGKFLASPDGTPTNAVAIPYCVMFNPGGTNTYSFANADGSGRTEFTMDSAADWGFPDDMKRVYNGLDLYLQRPFDGKWEMRVDYTFSKSKGNNEGQVKSEFGQDNISKTQDWDAAQIMTYASGYLANDRRHQLKVRGSYQINDEWLVGGSLRIMSGMPVSCLGYFNPDGSIAEDSSAADPIGYGASYHTCFGQINTPGSIRTPWTKEINLSATYRPAFADHKLALGVQVFNVLNAGEPTQLDVTSEDGPYTVSNTYLMPQSYQTPRYVQFSASYDF